MLARIDNFWIILAIIVGSAVWEWIKKRAEGSASGTGSTRSEPSSAPGQGIPPRPLSPTSTPTPPSTAVPPVMTPPRAAPGPAPAPASTPAAGSWEEELRRLLGGDEPRPAPRPLAPPPAPIRPVVIVQSRPAPSAPPPSVFGRPAAPARPAPAPMAGPRIAAADKAVDVQLPALQESTVAYRRASRLHEEVAQHLKRVEEMTERHLAEVPVAHRPAASADAARTLALIRSPAGVRQAIIASMIFGAPKALEGES